MSKIVIAAMIVIAIIAGAGLAKNAVTRTERNECLTWKKEAKQYPNFFLATWQRQQCDHYGIAVKN